jgi:hypothetical protein
MLNLVVRKESARLLKLKCLSRSIMGLLYLLFIYELFTTLNSVAIYSVEQEDIRINSREFSRKWSWPK